MGDGFARRIDPATFTKVSEFNFRIASAFTGTYEHDSIAVMPGRPQTVAINSGSIVIFDNGVARASKSTSGGLDSILFSPDGKAVFHRRQCDLWW